MLLVEVHSPSRADLSHMDSRRLPTQRVSRDGTCGDRDAIANSNDFRETWAQSCGWTVGLVPRHNARLASAADSASLEPVIGCCLSKQTGVASATLS